MGSLDRRPGCKDGMEEQSVTVPGGSPGVKGVTFSNRVHKRRRPLVLCESRCRSLLTLLLRVGNEGYESMLTLCPIFANNVLFFLYKNLSYFVA
ncbi:hypothetical protein NPIL_79981 [Nephila pilipes]|uniref:Uncharacterized protein n=1 Tax=Nephila pilipes TaxID=299642 RepID=A0A8X6Q128_NEPPI|nr:hypothetical protein NPIL_79981 [Nephila pilipes]